MTDITNQQLLDSLTGVLGTITDNMATKDDVRVIVKESEDRLSARIDGVDARFDKLEAKVDRHHRSNIHHHLTTRKQIGDLNQTTWS